MDIQELRHRAARGENLTSGELLEIAERWEDLERREKGLLERIEKQNAKLEILKGMTHQAFEAASQSRTIDQMREQSKHVAASDSPIFNSFEVAQVVYAFDIAEARYENLQKQHQKLGEWCNKEMTVAEVLADVDSGNVHPFSFQAVAALVQSMRDKTMLGRPMRNNVREVFQLLKAQPNALFYGPELKMVREWGTDHDRNLSIVKSRLGRAFTDPVGYMDTRFDLMLSKATKRQLLDGRVLTAQAYQHAVFARPDFLQIKPDWKLHDGKTQFHAGEHFHTRACDGMWWCGTHFNDLTGYQLMNILETALGELRLLYIHFPNGVTNEEPAK